MSKTSESYMLIDHRCSPGMPADYCERVGMPLTGGSVVELAVLQCGHCTQPLIKNPWRKRERAWCMLCDSYICDSCDGIRREPDYVHITWRVVIQLVRAGEAQLLEGSTHGRPRLLFLK
jgi:hypothetical protein